VTGMERLYIPATLIAERTAEGLYTLTLCGSKPWHCRAAEFPSLIEAWRALECVPQRLMDVLDPPPEPRHACPD
jgi:hypothetical protein